MPLDLSEVVAPFRMQPGLRRIEPGVGQLTPLGLDDPTLHEKLAVLRAHREQAFVCAPDFEVGAALHALAAHAAAEHPTSFEHHGPQRGRACRLGWSVAGGVVSGSGPAAIGHALQALPESWRWAGLLSLAFAEDFAVIEGATGCIPWLAVCLPSSWAPETKVGRHFTQVHAPVADNAALIAATDALLGLVTGNGRWERFVWTFTDSLRLDRHPARQPQAAWPLALEGPALLGATVFRSERQTFIPVTELRQAVFTIRVETHPLVQILALDGAADRLHAALASMSPAVLAYRSLTKVRDRLLAALAPTPAPQR